MKLLAGSIAPIRPKSSYRNCISSSNHRSAYGRQFSEEFTTVEKVLRIAGPSLRGSCNDDVVSSPPGRWRKTRAGAEIQKQFLGGMIKQRNTMMRQNESEVSAIKIIQHIFDKQLRVVLDIQEEMACGKAFDDTSDDPMSRA